jgi:hypothetical protein
MKIKLNNLKERFAMTEEQKEAAMKTAKTVAIQIALGVVVSVAVKQASNVIDEKIEEWKASRIVETIEES